MENKRGGGLVDEVRCSWAVAMIFPAYLRVLERQQIAANHHLHRLQSAFVLGSRSSVADGDQGGEDRLSDGGVEVHHHYLWQVE